MLFQSSQNYLQMQSHSLNSFNWKKENTLEKDRYVPFFRSDIESEQGFVSLIDCP